MSQIEWAEREVELAKKRERDEATAGDDDAGYFYACHCYDSALKAYKSLVEDDHSGMSISLTKAVLNLLIDGKALTPIDDTPDIWEDISVTHDGLTMYQCKRMSSLFKYVSEDGTVSYSDVNYAYYFDVDSKTVWHSKLIDNYVYSKYPITMPYTPYDKPFKVYVRTFAQNRPDAVGEYNHIALYYMIRPDGKREEIGKYYEEIDDGFKEITIEEWIRRYDETFKDTLKEKEKEIKNETV